MTMDSPIIKAQIAKLLRQLGGKEYTLIRTPTDPNGQPTGQPQEVGKVFGLSYIDPGIRNRVHIALPGMITSTGDVPTLTAVHLCGAFPQEGDLIRRCDQETKAMSVVKSMPLIIITTEELIP